MIVNIRYLVEAVDAGWFVWRRVGDTAPAALTDVQGSSSRTYETRADGARAAEAAIVTDREAGARIGVGVDAVLLESGEPLATLPELVALIGVSGGTIRWAMGLDGVPTVPYRVAGTPDRRYSVSDVLALLAAAAGPLEERRLRLEANEAAQRVAAEARRAANGDPQTAKLVPASTPRLASPKLASPKLATPAMDDVRASPGRRTAAPFARGPKPESAKREVLVMRRRSP